MGRVHQVYDLANDVDGELHVGHEDHDVDILEFFRVVLYEIDPGDNLLNFGLHAAVEKDCSEELADEVHIRVTVFGVRCIGTIYEALDVH